MKSLHNPKIIIACDSFKGSLRSEEVGRAVEKGIRTIYPKVETILFPLADGGEGTLDVFFTMLKGEFVGVNVSDPLGRSIRSGYGLFQAGKVAVIEMALASGLTLLREDERNPIRSSSFGTGELIRDALDRGVEEIILTVGGSATNDGGSGMLEALGMEFFDINGNPLHGNGGNLEKIEHIRREKLHPHIKMCRFVVLCDVSNPFTGENGATRVYSAQKGADGIMQDSLERGMEHFRELIRKETGTDLNDKAGSGAAGGMGGAAFCFLNAQFAPGCETILDYCGFASQLKHADLIFTGEGKMDYQTLFGKAPYVVLEKGRSRNIPVIGVCGIADDVSRLLSAGFSDILSIEDKRLSISEMMNPERSQREIEAVVASFLGNIC